MIQPISSSTFTAWAACLIKRRLFAFQITTEENNVTKKEKIAAEIEKAKTKRQELNEKIADLERRFKEEETLEMHEIVRRAKLTPEELSALIEGSPLTARKKTKEEQRI